MLFRSLIGTRVMDPNGELTRSMVRAAPHLPLVSREADPRHLPRLATPQSNILLPLPVEATKGAVYAPAQLAQIDMLFRRKLLLEWKTYAAHYFHAGGWWCRCSAQVFNEVRLAQ